MTATYAFTQSFGLMGLFASRVFLPTFAAALILRFGPELGLFHDLGLLALVTSQAPTTWFTDDLTLIVLGVLAAAELIAHKSAGARALLLHVDHYAKPAAAALTFLGVASVADLEFVESIVAQAGVGDYGFVLLVAAGTFLVARTHNAVVAGYVELDEDDDTGILRLFSWAQDLWSLLGVFFFILFPLVMMVLIGIAIGVIVLLRWRAEKREEKAKVPCPSCARPMYRSAIACAACGNANPAPTTVNWLGASTSIPVRDPQRQPLELVARKRCGRCATRLTERSPNQSCRACDSRPFGDPAFRAAYDDMVRGRLAQVLVVCGLLSLVPVIGLVAGVIHYRLALVAPYRRYVGRGRAILLRMAVKVFFFFLILFQWVPLFGGLVVPLMAWISHGVFRRAFFDSVQEAAVPRPAGVAARVPAS